MSGRDPTDLDAFRAAMGDVKPIKAEPRVVLKNSAESRFNSLERRKAATADMRRSNNLLSGDFVEQLDPHALLEFKRPGVQNGVYRNLRLGKYSIEARLDLHNHTIEQARNALFTFVKDCLQHDIRCALVTHGRGEGRQQPALIKSCVAHWLPQLDEVLAFHSAQKHHGSTGATYIMLRKSDRKRRDNLEKHQKRRS
ncbi:DNA endonuclease SmrA [Pseudomaricurvus alcaniphilus]|nr:DNA endonuclease SmrA [Pseudomaricurvus alcaniphilus]NHN39098.1 DNA endonuclease SmrA [Pseudomaricurvus alcaniphilus]